jgi:hemoglobin
MLQAHAGMNITEAEFGALVADLVAALDQFNVPKRRKMNCWQSLGPMQSDIVGK